MNLSEKDLLRLATAELAGANESLKQHQALIARQQKVIEFLLSEVKRLKEGRDI